MPGCFFSNKKVTVHNTSCEAACLFKKFARSVYVNGTGASYRRLQSQNSIDDDDDDDITCSHNLNILFGQRRLKFNATYRWNFSPNSIKTQDC